jgi:nucleoside-diphosphate-sugar epimerase
MTTLVLGGSGFIGRRLVARLVERGEDVVVVDLRPADAFEALGSSVRFMRGDITIFDDVMAATITAKPDRIVNMAYLLDNNPPHIAFRINVLGMENCFEAARLCDVQRVVFGSSLAVNGEQRHFGERLVVEDDFKYGTSQYATHKIFNEAQAADYRAKYGMEITAVRPANVAGVDKIVGSVDHVRVISEPARGRAVSFPYADVMRSPIHVDDMAELFARITVTDKPKHTAYNSSGTPISLGGIADMVRAHIPDAQISFEHETGGKDACTNWLIDNSRAREEFGWDYAPYDERLVQMIDEARAIDGLPSSIDTA